MFHGIGFNLRLKVFTLIAWLTHGGFVAYAVERHVPGEYATIQAAIDASSITDTVIVAPGVYTGTGNRDIQFRGKVITVRSVDPWDPNIVAGTVIDCQGSPSETHRGFYFCGSEGPLSIVEGLTITNGCADHWGGGGILCYSGCRPTIRHCRIIGNRCIKTGSSATGGGICVLSAEGMTIDRCVISGNQTTGVSSFWSGGGLYLRGEVVMTGCVITGNICGDKDNPSSANTWGSAIAMGWGLLTLKNCLIAGNQAYTAAGGVTLMMSGNNLTMINCTVVDNTDLVGDATLHCQVYSGVTIRNSILRNSGLPKELYITNNYDPNRLTPATFLYSDVLGGPNAISTYGNVTLTYGADNIDVDPLFADADGPDGDANTWQDNDYHLSPISPCIDAGDPNLGYSGQTDIDNEARVAGSRADIGSDEYTPIYKLTTGIINDFHGQVDVTPASPNGFYGRGACVTLHAISSDGKTFREWELFDPNHPDDSNYSTIDSNNPICVVMNSNRKVNAVFNCGSGAVGLPLAGVLATMCLLVLRLRHRCGG